MSQPSEIVSRILDSDSNPLVAITIVPKFRPSWLTVNISRSMGVIISRLRGKHRLVLTCKHAFANLDDKHECFLGVRKNKPCRLKMLGSPIFDPNTESDLAFVVVKDEINIPTEPLILRPEDLRVPNPSVLYNAKNVSDGVYRVSEIQVMRQFPVRERIDEIVFVKYLDPLVWRTPNNNTARIQELEQSNWQKCRSFNMVSRPGFSGSPIWNDNFEFIGMDIRGSNPGDESGDVTICLPSSQIFNAYNCVKNEIERMVDSY